MWIWNEDLERKYGMWIWSEDLERRSGMKVRDEGLSDTCCGARKNMIG